MQTSVHIEVATKLLKAQVIDLETYFSAIEILRRSPAEIDAKQLWSELVPDRLEQVKPFYREHPSPVVKPRGKKNLTAARTEVRPGAEPTLLHGALLDTQPQKRTTGSIASAPTAEVRPLEPQPVRYSLRKQLGCGGLGMVHEVLDHELERTVAMKVARDDLDRSVYRILQREAKIVASLEHPNIIPIHDAGYDDRGHPFYVMRQVTEPALDEVIERLQNGTAPTAEYNLKRLLRYFVQICHAVEYANQHGVVHCDLKPENILIGEYGDVLIVDWGLAYSARYPRAPRGGTPGYMAPEQFNPTRVEFDGRTDVFALGAILYQLVTLVPAIGISSSGMRRLTPDEILKMYSSVELPSKIQPDLAIPPEIDEICLKALEFDIEKRYQSAGELAEEIEKFLEGSKEMERRAGEAIRAIETGDDLAERYFEMSESRSTHLDNLRTQFRNTEPWASPADKASLWDAEDHLKVIESLRPRMLQAAVASYEQALDAVPDHPAARRGLAKLYHAELTRARRERNTLNEIHYSLRVSQYDDGSLIAESEKGVLEIHLETDINELTITQHYEDDRRYVAGERLSLESTDQNLDLDAGSWIVEAAGSGLHTSRFPVVIEPGSDAQVAIRLPKAQEIRANEVFVPGGPALLGGGQEYYGDNVASVVEVGSFAIFRVPVTFREYLDFIADLETRDPERANQMLPRTVLGRPRWSYEDNRWQAANFDNDGGIDDMLDLPAFGLSAADAMEYAAWLSTKHGVEYRLPSDSEWEKAARGTDGRIYPWGNHFDPTFCKMRFSQPGAATPQASCAFEADESPYGVRDLGGGVADWVLPDSRSMAYQSEAHPIAFSRGGSWCDWPDDCQATQRKCYITSESSARVGFRLARTVS